MTHRERPEIQVGEGSLGGGELFVLAGPCVLETPELALEIATTLATITSELGVPYVFKASFDKANRTSSSSERGPGMEEGLELLARVRREVGVPILTDVHLPDQCALVAEVADVLQIPAFLCRQTDLLEAAAATGRTVNIKKGQFLSPWDMAHVAAKVAEAGNSRILLTERGTFFGFGRLVVDMTSFDHLSATGYPVVFDATHSVQRPGSLDGRTGGDRAAVPGLARAAVATGQVDGLFLETHPDPDSSPSDGANMVRLGEFRELIEGVLRIHRALHSEG